MRNVGFAAASGLALLQLAAASCCRSNQCLRDIVSPDQDGIADCSSNLVVTVTPSAEAVTVTVTAVESATVTALFTKTALETASTKTLWFTESTSLTASTQTNAVTKATTVPFTTTVFQTAATVTSTSFQYQEGQTLKARQSASPELPGYASLACLSWDKYVAACKCAGVEPTTVTASPTAEVTVTEPAADTATVVSTLSSTVTDVVSVTATTSGTQTDIISLTATATTTQTDTFSSTVTTLQTTTPTTVVSVACQATGLAFRASAPFPDGTTRWMNAIGQSAIALQSFSTNPPADSLKTSTWRVGSDGSLELANAIGTATSVLVPYVFLSSTGSSVEVAVKSKSEVAAGVAAGTMATVKGCVGADSSQFVAVGNGRSNLISCGNTLYVSTGTGTDIRPDCVQLSLAAVQV